MRADEPYGIPRLGDLETAQAVTPQALQAHYETLLRSAPVELFYMGRQTPEAVTEQMTQGAVPAAQAAGPARQLPAMPGTPRPGPSPSSWTSPRASCASACGQIAMGPMRPAFVALQLLNVIFGSGIGNKLFLHVRENWGFATTLRPAWSAARVSCSSPPASTLANSAPRGMRSCSSWTPVSKARLPRDELETARRYLCSAWRASLNAPGRIDDFYLGQAICRSEATIETGLRCWSTSRCSR